MRKVIALVFAVGAALVLESCATAPPPVFRWSKAGATYQQFLQDRYACILQARTNTSSAFVYGSTGAAQSGQTISASIFLPCMAAKGYMQDANGFAPPDGGVVYMTR